MDKKLNHTDELVKLGLSEIEAITYETLISKGERMASNLKRHLPTTISRPMLYFVLDKLVSLNLVEKKERKNKPTLFSAKHPQFLENLLIKKQEELEKTKNSFEAVIGRITSDFNLQSNKPHIEFADGKEGAIKIIHDTFNSKETIYTYIDTDEMEKYASYFNREYISKRKDKNIKKKILMVDSPLAREKAKKNTNVNTEIRIMKKHSIETFGATANIYDGKVSFITFKELKIVATLIHDQEIYKMNRFVFESLWEKAEVI